VDINPHHMKMTQINIRLNEDIYEIISYLASKRMVPKSEIARELLLKSLTDDLLTILLKDYQAGKISLKNHCITPSND
jgi:predicted DNA-binding protein